MSAQDIIKSQLLQRCLLDSYSGLKSGFPKGNLRFFSASGVDVGFGSWVLISGVMSPLKIGVIAIVSLLITPTYNLQVH